MVVRRVTRAASAFTRVQGVPLISYSFRGFSSTPDSPVTDFSEVLDKKHTETQTFRTETKKLLEIVAKSLYTDKEVFVRELVSNAADALEKQRFLLTSGKSSDSSELQIKITTNESKNYLIIEDSGVGMTREDLINNLGTIARSGSKEFLDKLNTSDIEQKKTADTIIGQFGVGFYSSFIVAKEVRVLSKTDECTSAHYWVSDGSGSFEISDVEAGDLKRGTRITVLLKEDSKDFSKPSEITRILTKHSTFVSHPIMLNGSRANLKQAIWSRSKNEVTEEEYRDFFEYLTGSKTPYRYKLHFASELPVTLKTLLYIPSSHKEKFGVGAEESEIHLYSRKVLIKGRCRELLPSWLRFVKGIVDCEDIPLNISRETYQDTALMARIRDILTRRIIKLLNEEANRNETSYDHWYEDFGNFIVEGMALDSGYNKEIAPLARYRWTESDSNVSLPNYIKHMVPGQKKIYYIFATNRENALSSPYMEPFKPKNVPVLISAQHIDEMIFKQMNEYQGYKIVNIESSLDNLDRELLEIQEYDSSTGLPEDDIVPFIEWIKNELSKIYSGPTVNKVVISSRLKENPAMVIGDMPSAMRQVYKLMDTDRVNFI